MKDLQIQIEQEGYCPSWVQFEKVSIGEVYRFGPKLNHWMIKNQNGTIVCQDWSGKLLPIFYNPEKTPVSKKQIHFNSSLYNHNTSSYLEYKGILEVKNHLQGVLYAEDHLACPIRDINGHILSYQKIYGKGERKHFLKDQPRKGGFFSIGLNSNMSPDSFDELLFCEGLSTGCTLFLATLIPTIVTFGASNLNEVIGNFRNLFPYHKFMVCGDDDIKLTQKGKNNIGRDAALSAASYHECYIAFPEISDSLGGDFNDLHQREGLEVVKQQILNAFNIPPQSSPFPIILLEDLLDEDQTGYKKYEVKIGNKKYIKYIKASDVEDTKKIKGILAGWFIDCEPHQFKELIPHIKKKTAFPTSIMNNECGWRENGDFYLPPLDKMCINEDYKNFERKGSLLEFKEQILPLAKKNPLLIFILSYSFLPPFLKKFNLPNFGIHLFGESSIGKTTLLNLCASLWGSPVEQWNGTPIGFEELAYRYKDTLLCLDEIHQIKNSQLPDIIYSLGNGGGRIRFKSREKFKSRKLFKINFLSSGESSIQERLKSEFTGGQGVRIIDIDCHRSHGIFDVSDNPRKDIMKLNKIIETHKNNPIHHLINNFDNAEKYFNLNEIENDFNKQMGRIKELFILIEKAGITAVKLGCLPSLDISGSVQTIFSSLKLEENSSYEIEIAKRRLYELLETGEAHFYKGDQFERIPYHIKGYIKNEDIYITSTVLKNEICKDINFKSVKDFLIKDHILDEAGAIKIGNKAKWAYRVNDLWIEQYQTKE